MTDTRSQASGGGEAAPDDEASISKDLVGFNAINAALGASMRGALPKLDRLGVTTGLQISLPASIIGVGQISLGASILGTLPKLDHLGFGIGQTSPAASILGVRPKFDHLKLSTGFNFRLGQSSLGAAMGTQTAARLLTLEQGFLKGTGTAADSFGDLDDAIGTDQELAAHLRRSVATTQRPGSFGFDYSSLRGEASGFADRFVDEPALGRQVRSALEPVQEITGLTDELLIDYGEQLGWWKIITRHKISTAGTILGYTIGLVTFIAGTGSGISSAPSALVEALIIGGGIYNSFHSAENDKH
jgi:hypothetical protein